MSSLGGPQGTGLDCGVSVTGPCCLSSIVCLGCPPHTSDLVETTCSREMLRGKSGFDILGLRRRHRQLDALFHGGNCCCFHPRFVAFHTSALHGPKVIDLRIIPGTKIPTSTGEPCCVKGASVCLAKCGKRRPASSVIFPKVALRCDNGGPNVHLKMLTGHFFCRGKRLCSRTHRGFARRTLTHLNVFGFTRFHCTPRSALPKYSALGIQVGTAFSLPCSKRLRFGIAAGDASRANPKTVFDLSQGGFVHATTALSFRLGKSCR